MKRTYPKGALAAIAALAIIAGCSGDLSKSSSPVTLVVTNQQTLTQIDISSPTAASCNGPIATVSIRPILLTNTGNTNLPVDPRFNTVQLTSYRVSYVRRDGGTLVPAPFTRATSGLLTVNQATSLNNFLGFEPGALSQAPFAALTPSGGNRDPETGKTIVTMDAILEIFGETLAGERVSGNTRLTLNFCYSCGGCK